MAKLIFSAITSLDGYIEDEEGNFDWGAPDEQVHSFVNDLERPVGTYLYGRRMYETMVVEPGGWGGIGELKNLVLPPDDNVIVSVHCYDPFYFTHQGATWTSGQTPVVGFIFPGPPAQPLVPDEKLQLKKYQLDWIEKYNTLPADKNPSSPLAFTGKLKYLHAWSDYYGRPIHLGEFGAYTKADEQRSEERRVGKECR